MASTGVKRAYWIVGLLTILMLLGSCRQNEAPDVKQARLIAAENMQLNERLSKRDADMARLEARHAKAIEQKEAELAACRKRIDALRRDLADRVDSVMAAVMAENTKLRREIDQLKAQLQIENESSE